MSIIFKIINLPMLVGTAGLCLSLPQALSLSLCFCLSLSPKNATDVQ